jgi:hypothetical protein
MVSRLSCDASNTCAFKLRSCNKLIVSWLGLKDYDNILFYRLIFFNLMHGETTFALPSNPFMALDFSHTI